MHLAVQFRSKHTGETVDYVVRLDVSPEKRRAGQLLEHSVTSAIYEVLAAADEQADASITLAFLRQR